MMAISCWLLADAGGALGSTYFVDTAQPDNTGDGQTWETTKRTIGAGIAASAAGDTILVKYGTYVITTACNLTSDRKITSDDGNHTTWDGAAIDSSQCVIDADAQCRVFTLAGAAITRETQVRGFGMTGGDATYEGDPNYAYGGGIYISDGASPIIERCWITGNLAGAVRNGYGGGIACCGEGTDAEIRRCWISDNTACSGIRYGRGGGIYGNESAETEVYQNVITGNIGAPHRSGLGGGICCSGAGTRIWANTISSNHGNSEGSGGGGHGGGIYISGAVEAWQNLITGNVANESYAQFGAGGGVYIDYSEGFLHHNEITNNIASRGHGGGGSLSGTGGGVCCEGGYVLIAKNLVAQNAASTCEEPNRHATGGGIKCAEGNHNTVRGNIVSENAAARYCVGYGGGIYFNQSQTIERNVFWRNTASLDEVDEAGFGGGAYSYNASGSALRNNTFYRNANQEVDLGGAGSGYCHASDGTPWSATTSS